MPPPCFVTLGLVDILIGFVVTDFSVAFVAHKNPSPGIRDRTDADQLDWLAGDMQRELSCAAAPAVEMAFYFAVYGNCDATRRANCGAAAREAAGRRSARRCGEQRAERAGAEG